MNNTEPTTTPAANHDDGQDTGAPRWMIFTLKSGVQVKELVKSFRITRSATWELQDVDWERADNSPERIHMHDLREIAAITSAQYISGETPQ